MGAFNTFIAGIGGRKFVMAIIAVVAVVLGAKFGISEEQTLKIGGIAASFILAQGAADGLSKGATSTVAQLGASDEKSST